MNSIHNKIIWITGASSGIGQALAIECFKRGARIIISARNHVALEALKHKLGAVSANCMVLPFDLAEKEKFPSLIMECIQSFGVPDILINNGGISQRSNALETNESTERLLMEVNYFAPVLLSKLVLPYMIKNGGGNVVVISSIAGKFGFYLRSSYSASKHALHGYFESLRLENEEKGIKVLIVCPGKIKTDISKNALIADGSQHNTMDESHIDAMSSEECAIKIIEGITQNKEELLIGRREIKAVKLKRFFPKLFGKIIRKQSPY